jgi:SAM-dependent methyltransferase
MGQCIDIVTPLHRQTNRDYLARMTDDKVACMRKAKEYGPDYWDGDRRYGYGGYRYLPGRWKPVALALMERYGLGVQSRVLDVGCGKAFLLYELQLLLPGIELVGFDISEHALRNRHREFTGRLFRHPAQDPYPFRDGEFDLVISLGTLHNLRLPELRVALSEIERVGRDRYVMMESYRNEQELFNLECWALTAETLLGVTEWEWLFTQFGYSGDYEFIFFD